jgi:hypothetical protein
MKLENIQVKGDIIFEMLSNGEIQDEIEKAVKKQFNQEKRKTLLEFDNHDVTQELAEPEKGNISNTLGGYGDLFGFIGFEAGYDPVLPVKLALESKIKFKSTNLSILYPRNVRGQFATGKRTKILKVTYQVPDLNDFSKSAKFQGWNGNRNWIKGIERGISGVSYYADYPRGRSERGLQLRGPIKNSSSEMERPSSFKTRPYITEIVENFKKNFKNKLE